VEDDFLYIGTAGGKVISYTLIDVSGGNYAAERWQFPPKGEPGLGASDGGSFLSCSAAAGSVIYSTTYVANGTVYFADYAGTVYALNSSSRIAGHSFPQQLAGEWEYPDEGDIGNIVGSPVVADGILYIGSSDGNLYALDTATGKPAWDSPYVTGDQIWSTPVVHEGVVYVGSFDDKLHAIDTAAGTSLWEFEAGGTITATPLIYNGTIYFGSFDRKFYAVDASTGQAKEGFVPYTASDWFWGKALAYDNTIIVGCLDNHIYALDSESGALKWDYETGGPVSGDPAMLGELVFFGSNDGKVHALNATNGNEIWIYPHGEDYFGPMRSPLYAGDGEVYVHDQQNNKLYSLGALDGREIWSVSTLD
jgi:outer membrane protein assembly factor BamB